MNNTINANTKEKQYSVMLPCEPEQFKEFINGLLGKPQTITQEMHGVFTVDKQSVINLHHLICQRIEQQNHGALIQHTARIVFNDGSSVLLNSLADFESYYEIRPVTSTEVHLSWSFLIQFPDRKFPEKQVVEISFTTGGGTAFNYERGEEIVFRNFGFLEMGSAGFRIQHTARTWGADIQGLLANHLNSILVKEHPFRAFVRKHSGKLSGFVSGAFFFIVVAEIFRTGSKLISIQNGLITQLKADSASKLDYIVNVISSGLWERYLLTSFSYLFIAIFVSIVIAIFIESRADTTKPSFILLTPQAELNKTKKLSKYNRKTFELFLSVIFTLVSGVAGNYMYDHLLK